jgi:hypothetical protein
MVSKEQARAFNFPAHIPIFVTSLVAKVVYDALEVKV